MTETPRAACAAHLTPAERVAVEEYLSRLTGNVRNLADRLEALRAGLRQPALPSRLPVLLNVRPRSVAAIDQTRFGRDHAAGD